MSLYFLYPQYLWLLILLPLLWWISRQTLASLGSVRRWVVIALRSAVLLLLVFSLAQAQWVRTAERLTVLYLIDQSLSIPAEHRQAMAAYVNSSIEKHRKAELEDRAGVIVFARDAAVEHPPIDDNIRITPKAETSIDPIYTNLARALKLAAATLPGDSASRLVIVTDGNENIGNSLEEAKLLAERGVGIDIVPVRYTARSEIAVEKIAIPNEVHRGQTFDLRVVVNNITATDKDAPPVKGRLQIFRKTRDQEQLISESSVELPAGKKVFSLNEKIDQPEFYTYTSRFVPDDKADDHLVQNNQATAFTHVHGQGRVLLIEDSTSPGEFDLLVDRLRQENLQVTLINTDELFTSLGELQPFDTVILANVPREAFSLAQIDMLVANTQQMGAGLIMLGGPNSFGAGGWAETKIEEALPVYCQVKNPRIRPVGALGLVIDRSGSMSGEKMEMAIRAARASVEMIGDRDYVTVTAFDSSSYLIVPLVKKGESQTIQSRINRLSADGGTNMEPAIRAAFKQLSGAGEAATKHMVVLTDGHTEGSNYPTLIQNIRRSGITVSTVAVGSDADLKLLDTLARIGNGRFYHAKTARILPKIFQTEARVVSRPLVYERKSGLQPEIKFPHEMLKGIEQPPPPITGYVLTTRKENPLVEVAMLNPLPAEEENRTLLASWTYGLGKVVAFTSDAGRRWAGSWTSWPNYDKLFSQMVRWSMRPSGAEGKFDVIAEAVDDKVRVVVNALDKDDEYLNFLTPLGSAVGPDMKPRDLRFKQVAPGRYIGEFQATDPGAYHLMLVPGAGMAPILTGVNVPYSAELLDRDTNEGLLTTLAALTPVGGESGVVIEPNSDHSTPEDFDVFRHNLKKASSSQDAWPQLLVLLTYLFLADVFVRRVHISFEWVPVLARKLKQRFGRRVVAEPVETMARLRSRKAAVAESIEARRESVQFEPSEPSSAPLPTAAEMLSPAPKPRPADAPTIEPSEVADDSSSYTNRLLKAKQQARAEQRRDS